MYVDFIFQKRFFIRLVLAFLHLALISTSVYTRPVDDLLAVHDSSDVVSTNIISCFCLFSSCKELKDNIDTKTNEKLTQRHKQ